ncbi:MAG: glycosyltransferase [Bacteroidota bacterium]
MSRTKGVSVVICTYNGAQRLKPTLEHIAAQKTENLAWETILIDNNSKDESAAVARTIWDAADVSVPLRIVKEEQAGLSYAKARGLKEAQYGYLIYVDDDNSISDNYVQTVFEILEAHSEVAVCSGDGEVAVPADFELPTWWEKFQYAYAVGKQGEEEGYLENSFLWGASSAFRVSALEELYEVHELYLTGRIGSKLAAGEDGELCLGLQLLGYKLYYSPQLQFKHHIPTDRINRDYLKRLQEGFGAASVILSLYSDLLKDQKMEWQKAIQKTKQSVRRRTWKMLKSSGEQRKNIQMNLSYSKGRLAELKRFKNEYDSTYDLLKERFYSLKSSE